MPKLRLERHESDALSFCCAGKVSPYAATGGSMFFMLKAFGAGVILATGFIHMWPDANDAFSNTCLGGCPLHIKRALGKALGNEAGKSSGQALSGTAMLWCVVHHSALNWKFAEQHRADQTHGSQNLNYLLNSMPGM